MNSGVRQFWAGSRSRSPDAAAAAADQPPPKALPGDLRQRSQARLPERRRGGLRDGCQALLAQDKPRFRTASISSTRCTPAPERSPPRRSTAPRTLRARLRSGLLRGRVGRAHVLRGECNTVANTATTIDETQVAGALPAAEAAGGSFAPGTYFRTSATVYTGLGGATGPNGATDKQTLVLSAATTGGGAFVAQSVYPRTAAPTSTPR